MMTNRIIMAISILCVNVSLCVSQKQDTLWNSFIKSEFFESVVVKHFESEGFDVYSKFNNETFISDICFTELLTNTSYQIKDTGIWKVGINSSHPIYYLLFRYKGKNYFEYCDIQMIISRYNDYLEIVQLSKTEKLILLFSIVKYLNECLDYPIESIIPK